MPEKLVGLPKASSWVTTEAGEGGGPDSTRKFLFLVPDRAAQEPKQYSEHGCILVTLLNEILNILRFNYQTAL